MREVGVSPSCHPRGMRTIDCDECVMRGTVACDDCVVSFIVKRERGEAVVVDVEEERALRALYEGGLAPGLRHRPRRVRRSARP